MTAQDELKQIFAELDRSTDRVLDGLAQVRSGSKLTRFRPSRLLLGCEIGSALALAMLLKLWLERGFY
ncbi:hypothetical protein [Roseibium suaedae]|uniref:Uncharacterized protein n=1 Tax=Roseibium suaedae TaxID=735517 RepID=A0A1M7EX95_9HYPH|nr:hypothetical protein [Roseibium suaedae]SHL96306.1 hypothetical protein SAMN05444272_1418 [Roseibium suaedae]